jgi:hypothetical protein
MSCLARSGLPDAWDEGVAHEVAAGLGISLSAADKLIGLAWTLEARLPRIGAALDAGVIDYVKGGWSFAPWPVSQILGSRPIRADAGIGVAASAQVKGLSPRAVAGTAASLPRTWIDPAAPAPGRLRRRR